MTSRCNLLRSRFFPRLALAAAVISLVALYVTASGETEQRKHPPAPGPTIQLKAGAIDPAYGEPPLPLALQLRPESLTGEQYKLS